MVPTEAQQEDKQLLELLAVLPVLLDRSVIKKNKSTLLSVLLATTLLLELCLVLFAKLGTTAITLEPQILFILLRYAQQDLFALSRLPQIQLLTRIWIVLLDTIAWQEQQLPLPVQQEHIDLQLKQQH